MKSRVVAAILAFVFSFIGAHNFYLVKQERECFVSSLLDVYPHNNEPI